MGYLIPKEELKIEDIIAIRRKALAELESMIRATGEDPASYIVRDILPKTDFGWDNDEWKITYSSAYTDETKVDVEVPSQKFFVFYGVAVKSPDPKTLKITFKTPAQVIDVIQLEKLYVQNEYIGYFKDVVKFRGKERMQIAFYGKTTGDDYVVLMGLVAELKGKTIAKNK